MWESYRRRLRNITFITENWLGSMPSQSPIEEIFMLQWLMEKYK